MADGDESMISKLDAENLASKLKTFKLLTENNVLALGVLVPVLLLVPGVLDEILAIVAVAGAGLAAVLLRGYLIKNKDHIRQKLENAKDEGRLDESVFSEAMRNLNSVTVSR